MGISAYEVDGIKCLWVYVISTVIRIGPDRAYPLHFTRPQLLLLLPVLLPVLLPLLTFEEFFFAIRCSFLQLNCHRITLIRIGPDRAYPLYFTHPQLLLLPLLFFYIFGPYPLK